jgi:hypothetical protein
VRSLIGKDLPRSFELAGDQLIVKSTRTDEHWKVTSSITRPYTLIGRIKNDAKTQTWKKQS